MQVSRRECDRRKRVPAAGLYRDSRLFTDLVTELGNLRFGCRDCNRSVCVHSFDLTIHPLDHGFIAAIFGLENLNELFGADIIGKRPEPLSGTAG